MKKILVTLLTISTSTLILPANNTIRLPGVSFIIPSNINLSLRIGIVITTLLFIFWMVEEVQSNNIFNKIKLSFHKHLRRYMENKGDYINNLKELFSEINPSQDRYYINGTFVLTKTNNFNNGDFTPDGYILRMNKIKYYFLINIKRLRIILSWEFFQYVGLFFWSLAIILIFTFQLICNAF